MDNNPTIAMIEIRGIYDVYSVDHKADGTLTNRWPADDRRHKPTQDWIDSHGAEYLADWGNAHE